MQPPRPGPSIGEAARRAIDKLEHMLPSRLRQQIELSSTLIRVQPPLDDVDSGVLRVISAACRAHDELAVTYRDRNGRVTDRRLLPYRVVSIGRRWYVVARDARLPEWRTWRVDRIVARRSHRPPVRADRSTRRGRPGATIDQHRSVPASGTHRADAPASTSHVWCHLGGDHRIDRRAHDPADHGRRRPGPAGPPHRVARGGLSGTRTR